MPTIQSIPTEGEPSESQNGHLGFLCMNFDEKGN